jgi:hypothetical protein
MKVLSFPTTLIAAVLCGAVGAACTAPDIGSGSSNSAQTGDGSSGSTKKPATKSAPATKSPVAKQQVGDDDDDNGPAPTAGKSPNACMTKCIGNNADAMTLYSGYAGCESKCKASDTACDAQCNTDVNTKCNAQPDACQIIDTCSAKCPSTSGSSSGSSGGGGGLTFADVQGILANSCASCHHHQGQYGTLADVQAAQQDILAKVQSGDMPPSDSSFAQSADGQKLLSWLQSGTDLQ